MKLMFHSKIMKKLFSLIELLIVISVIFVLMSLLMPGMRRFHEQANRVLCANNLSQVHNGLIMYSYDMNGHLPDGQPAVRGAGVYAIKIGGLWLGHGKVYKHGYMTGIHNFYCPSTIHPFHSIDGGNMVYGGFRSNLSAKIPSIVTSSYQYRSTFGRPFRGPSALLDDLGSAIMSDHVTHNYSIRYTHGDGHTILYLDGSTNWNNNVDFLSLDLSNVQHYALKNQFWEKVDR